MQLTREGALPEAVYVLIDIIDLPHRSRELTCKDDFWLAVQEELMPQLADWAPHSDKPPIRWWRGKALAAWPPVCRTALAAALRCGDHPVRFLLVAAARHAAAAEHSRRRLLADAAGRTSRPGQPRRAEGLYGSRFAGKAGASGQRRNGGTPERRRHRVHYRVVEGGHDALCWRSGLTDGLQAVWASAFATAYPASATATARGTHDGKPESVR